MASFQRARFERSLQPKATHPDDLAVAPAEPTDRLPDFNTRPSFDDDRRYGHVAACNLLRAQYARRIYDR